MLAAIKHSGAVYFILSSTQIERTCRSRRWGFPASSWPSRHGRPRISWASDARTYLGPGEGEGRGAGGSEPYGADVSGNAGAECEIVSKRCKQGGVQGAGSWVDAGRLALPRFYGPHPTQSLLTGFGAFPAAPLLAGLLPHLFRDDAIPLTRRRADPPAVQHKASAHGIELVSGHKSGQVRVTYCFVQCWVEPKIPSSTSSQAGASQTPAFVTNSKDLRPDLCGKGECAETGNST